MKLNRLKSIASNAIRTSIQSGEKYMIDPFEHHTPEFEIEVDLISGTLKPDLEGDSVETYYKAISKWFREVLPKEGIPFHTIEKAVIKLSPKGKTCIIQAQGKEYQAYNQYKL